MAASARQSGSFIDDNHSPYEPLIERARAVGLVRGCNPPANDRFCPTQVVTRAEMAVMLDRAMELPPANASHFVDDPDDPTAASIEALAEAGITQGCSLDHFCPDRSLTRGEMGQLIVEAMGWVPPDSLVPYSDLGSSPYGAALAVLGRRGDVEPCDPPLGRRLCPSQPVTRGEAVYALASAMDLQPLGTPATGPTADDLSVGFADGFDSLSLWDGRTPSSRNRVSLTDGGFEGKGLRVTIPKGSHFGSDFRLDLSKQAGQDPEELYFRYMLRLDPDWAPVWSGKLPGFSGVYGRTGKGGYPSTPSSPGWSARVQFFGTKQGDARARLGYYVYHLGQERRYGDKMMWNEAGKLEPGQWYCIEGEVDMNTLGLADGALRAWVDGTPAFNVDGIEFRRPDEPNIRIESLWFDVYYGGKPVAEKTMGMTIDQVAVDTQRVGCGGDATLSTPSRGDFDGDGFDDLLWWGPCPGGTCFQVDESDGTRLRLGDGAWFSLETQQLGMALGDVDGDGRQDVIYRGRCESSQPCWRVQSSRGSSLGPGEDWGDGARFAPGAAAVITGDWNGDGLDDVTYQGLCGSKAAACWRTHLSLGDGFDGPADWGPPGPPPETKVEAADLNSDGRDDLVYRSDCPKGTCWFAQYSTGSGFGSPVRVGTASPAEADWWRWFDYNGDGSADLLSLDGGGATLAVRSISGERLSGPHPVAALPAKAVDLAFRRVDGQVQALATLQCKKGKSCVDKLLSWDGSLVPEVEYHRHVITGNLLDGQQRVA